MMIEFLIEKGHLNRYVGNAEHVVIPDGIISIDPYAFYNCKNIESVEIPSSVEIIGNVAFRCCTNLRSIEIPNSVKFIDCEAFAVCSSLESIKLPNSIKRIGSCAFEWCTKLTSIKIPNSVENIGHEVFRGCYNVSNIEIPNNVKFIGFNAFERLQYVKPQYNANGSLRAFKAFNGDWTCRHFQYKIGKSYHQGGIIACCGNGFHACPNPLNVFNHYDGFLCNLRFAEVELNGAMDWENDKVAASDIKIIRELSVSELAEIYNSMEKE